MNHEAILALISDLYTQVTSLQQQNEKLQKENETLKEKKPESST